MARSAACRAPQGPMVPGEQPQVGPGPRHALRAATLAEARLRPPMPVSGRIPLAASTGHVPQKGARDRRAARITTPLAALERAEQEALGPTSVPGRPGQG